MTMPDPDTLIRALDLPPAAKIERGVKTMLLDHGTAAASDRKLLEHGIEELTLLADLKPTSIAVPAFRDDVREYLEIFVLKLKLRPRTKPERIIELIHRTIAYPLLLLTQDKERIILSFAHQRWAQNETGRVVLDGNPIMIELRPDDEAGIAAAFAVQLALGRQPHTSLYALYQGWIDTGIALAAARYTGAFRLTGSVEQSEVRRTALTECRQEEAEIARLRAAAGRERQMPRQVELNLELKRREAQLAAARAKL